MNHFTDVAGFNSIRSQPCWTFKAVQPRASHHPVGAYFTNYDVTEPNLSKKIFVPVVKLAFVFSFTPPKDLLPLPHGRGRLGRIFYSFEDYDVERSHQLHHGETGIK